MSQIGTASGAILEKNFYRSAGILADRRRRSRVLLLSNEELTRFVRAHESFTLCLCGWGYLPLSGREQQRLQGYDSMNAIGAKHAKLTLVVPTEIDLATAALRGAGQRNLVNGAHTLAIFIFKKNNRLSSHGRREAKVGKFNNLAAYRLLCGGEFRLGIHSTIEADAMYPLK
jgi:hypothetical protein